MPRVRVMTLTCQRCGHAWIPRVPDVRQCARCKSAYWDTPRQKPPDTRKKDHDHA
jgi:predicted Zn-ribbon and HTH transcriptional regulator